MILKIKTPGGLILGLLVCFAASGQQSLKVGVAGLSHDHAHGLMQQHSEGKVHIAGIAEKNRQLRQRYKQRYHLPDSLFFDDLVSLLEQTRPEAVLAYNAISEHLAVVEACAPRGISVMVEKPLAFRTTEAERMAALARKHHIHVLTNYETTWYDTNQQLYKLVKEGTVGSIRKMVAHDGHQGPEEIGCSPDFLTWLTDPAKNGGGALVDFGCYGANLMTWLMDGQTPVAVTAVTRQVKPDKYPNVDDDATIVLEYPGATGIIQASWDWPFNIKDLEVYGNTGYLHAVNSRILKQSPKDASDTLAVEPAPYRDNLTYLGGVLRGRIRPDNDLSSLENNLVVVKILEAARKSAQEGKRIAL